MVPTQQFFAAAFAVSHAKHISDLHSKFALRPHHMWKYGRHPICDGWDLARKKRQKEEEEGKKPYGKNIMVCPIPQGDHNY